MKVAFRDEEFITVTAEPRRSAAPDRVNLTVLPGRKFAPVRVTVAEVPTNPDAGEIVANEGTWPSTVKAFGNTA